MPLTLSPGSAQRSSALPPADLPLQGAGPVVADCAVLKIGGALLTDAASLSAFADHVAARRAQGERVVVVHGGGNLVSGLQARLDVPVRKVGGLRATSPEALTLVTMGLRGLANTRVVSGLVARGLPALGLSGLDAGLLRSDFLDRDALGAVGGAPRVAIERLERLLRSDFLPVVAPLCLGPEGGALNVNADTVARALAVALGAQRLDFLTDVPGVLDAEGRVRARISAQDLAALDDDPSVQGGMRNKLTASGKALELGVPFVRIGSVEALAAERATVLSA